MPGFNISESKAKPAKDLLTSIREIGVIARVKKGDEILSSCAPSDSFLFIRKGVSKTLCRIDRRDHIIGFTFAGDIICDPARLFGDESSSYVIEAITDCEVLTCKWDDLRNHMQGDSYRMIVDQFVAHYIISLQNRIVETLSVSAKARYKELIVTHTKRINQIPIADLASYLGITPQSISRIRTSKFR